MQTEFLDTAEAEFAGLVEQNAAVAAQLAAAEETGEAARAQFLRLTADFDNFRKRTVRPRSERCSLEIARKRHGWACCARFGDETCYLFPGPRSSHTTTHDNVEVVRMHGYY